LEKRYLAGFFVEELACCPGTRRDLDPRIVLRLSDVPIWAG
jgi:hypothetical protein